MSRTDSKTTRVDLGPCDCPRSPHVNDWADCRDNLTYGDLRRSLESPGVTTLMLRCTDAWSLVDARGAKLPISIESFDSLSLPQATRLVRHYNAPAYRDQVLRFTGDLTDETPEAGLPNPSSGPSADGSAETPAQPTSSPATDATDAVDVSSAPPSPSTASASPPSSQTSS